MIVAGIFDLTYAVTYLRIVSTDPREGKMELENKVFGYLKKYTKQ